MTFADLLAFAGRNPILSLALAGLTVAIVANEVATLLRGYKALKPAELTALMNTIEDAVVVDISPSADFEKGHIAGSRNVQASQFGPEHKLVAAARQKPVVVVCRSGMTAQGAAKKLKKAGFEQVYVLDGGVAAWRQAELPLVKGRA
ncbi:MAG TPA: rhodanese-like domain-containing protein [Xanthomonadaceae bacterium]|nr:rhodanese-like domain-containing protein [Xanthomonadaceae bacterium]